MVHLDPSVECHGCYRIFTTYAGMIIHLESGSCDSSINVLVLNESAALRYQWKRYIDEDYHEDMVDGYDLYLVTIVVSIHSSAQHAAPALQSCRGFSNILVVKPAISD